MFGFLFKKKGSEKETKGGLSSSFGSNNGSTSSCNTTSGSKDQKRSVSENTTNNLPLSSSDQLLTNSLPTLPQIKTSSNAYIPISSTTPSASKLPILTNESASLCDLTITTNSNSSNGRRRSAQTETCSKPPISSLPSISRSRTDSRNNSNSIALKEKFFAQSSPPNKILEINSSDLSQEGEFSVEMKNADDSMLSVSDVEKSDKFVACNGVSERDLSDAEKKAIGELDNLRSKLLSKETEISLLHADINMLSADRDNKIVDVEGMSAQLRKLNEENDNSLATIQSIETELQHLRSKNAQLTEELLKKAEHISSVELEKFKTERILIDDKIKQLELQVKNLEKERDDLIQEHEAIEVEREEELRAVQNSLDDAHQQKIKIKAKYEQDFQALKSACSAQEQQLMDDFEWKLRQVEQSWKKKLTEKERLCDEKMQDLRGALEKELVTEKDKLKEEKIQVDQQMRQVCHYKSYEVEVVQLRGLTHEQQKSLRAAARQIEHLKFSEKVVHDELSTVRTLLEKQKAHLQVVQGSHQRRLDSQEENIQSKLDKQKNELNSKWEDRMRGECTRLKQDLCKLHIEEKHLAVESMKLQKEQALSSARQVWERQRKDLLHEISKLKDTITEKESTCHREMEKLTTQADRETWELRRILEKTSNNHSDQITQMEESHADVMESLQKRHDELVEQLEKMQTTLTDTEEKLKQKTLKEESKFLEVAIPHTILVNKSDSGCGDETTDSDRDEVNGEGGSGECSEEEDEDDEEDDDEAATNSAGGANRVKKLDELKPVDAEEDEVVSHLREEVANLQGSIEKLTSTLNTTETSCSSLSDEASETSSDVAESDEDDDEDDDDDE